MTGVNWGLIDKADDYRKARLDRQIAEQNISMGDLKLEELRSDREAMLGLQERLKASGKDTNLEGYMDQLIATGRPDLVEKGLLGKQKLKEQAEFAKALGGDESASFGTNALAGTPQGGQIDQLAGAIPASTLQPPQGIPAPQQQPFGTNALAQSQQQGASNLQSRVNRLIAVGTPEALKAAEVLQKFATKETQILPAGAMMVGPDGRVIKTNPRAVGGTGEGGTGGTEGYLIKQYMASTGADFPTALKAVRGDKGAEKPDELSKYQRAQLSNQLRDDFTAATKDYSIMTDAYNKASSLPETPAGDLALLYQTMKANDPTSVVRESEFAQMAKAGSFGDAMQNAVSRTLSGERLTPVQREDFKNTIYSQLEAQKVRRDALEADYTQRAASWGLNPSDVLPKTATFKKREKALPKGIAVEGKAPEIKFLGFE